jgi:flagellar protein FliO/FliZ
VNRLNLLCLVLLLFLPERVQGASGQDSGSNFSFLASFLQMIAALMLVVGLILLVYYVMTRLLRKMPVLRSENQHIRVLEVRAMGPRKALILVEIAGEYLLLASSGEQLGLIKQINMLEEIEVVPEILEKPSFLSFLKRVPVVTKFSN